VADEDRSRHRARRYDHTRLRHLIHRRHSPEEVDELSNRSPYREEVDDLAGRGLAALDMITDSDHGDLQHSLDGGLTHAEVLSDLLVRQPSEVRQLDGLLVAGRQGVQCFVDSLADHCGREVVPGQRPVGWIRRPLDHQLLEAPVRTVDAPPVDWRPARARHQPRSPGGARRRRQHDEVGLLARRAFVLRAIGLARATRSGQPPTQETIPR
jgi:hypothetical protein